MNELNLHDIKTLVEIPDYSFYIFITLIIFALSLVFALAFLIYKIVTNRKKDLRKEYFKKLKELDLKDSKHAAYVITKYARFLANNEREKRLCTNLIEELEVYKYKKDVNNLSKEAILAFERFMDSVDV